MTAIFSPADIAVFVVYSVIMLATGWYFNRKTVTDTQSYFLGGNQVPTWVAAISVLATSQSAATFLGGPDQGYRGDFSYLATNMGAFIAALFVAFYLIPQFYKHNVTTVYELLGSRFGPRATKQAGAMYLFGRVFASGARLFMAAIAVSLIMFGDISAFHVSSAVFLLGLTGVLFAIFGGVKSVIYNDAIQCFTYVLAALLVLYTLYSAIPADFDTILAALDTPAEGVDSKLTVLDTSWDITASGVFNVWSIFTGFVLLNIAAFGLDQDMTQRVLACKSPKEGAKALLYSVIMLIPVLFIFIAIGSLLYLFYQRPDIMALESTKEVVQTFSGEKITIFMYYVLNEIPSGIRGIVTVGVIAAALSTLNSGLNSMSSVVVLDFYKPWLAKRGETKSEAHFVKAGRISTLLVAFSLMAMAVLCYFWQQYSDVPLLAFALSVMVFSYSGLLGIYFTALFTKRGNEKTVGFALVAGFLVTLLLQPYAIRTVLPEYLQFSLGFTWQLCLGTLISFLICFAGKPNVATQETVFTD